MCKLQNIKGKDFIVYYLRLENYVGVTTNLQQRLLKHSSRSKFCIDNDNVDIIFVTKDLNNALEQELKYQKLYKCIKGVRNQEGNKNPYAKAVLDLKSGIFYETIKEACVALQYNYSSVRTKIKNIDNKYNLIKI